MVAIPSSYSWQGQKQKTEKKKQGSGKKNDRQSWQECKRQPGSTHHSRVRGTRANSRRDSVQPRNNEKEQVENPGQQKAPKMRE